MSVPDEAQDGATTPAQEGGPIPAELLRANAAHWDEWTRVHAGSTFYDVDGFRTGATSLWPLELEELGPLVGEGTTLLHLQCHFGLDTLSWARRGAVVTGVDLSEEAIGLARRLADEFGLAGRARFIAADVYEADAELGDELFDVVFVSWGAIEWLPDLERWARIVARHLRAGGVFFMAEIHPIAYALDETPDHGVRLAHRYLPAPHEPDRSEDDGSYADAGAHVGNRLSYSWAHGMGEILTAISAAGLRLEHLHEFPCSVSPFFDWMERDEQRWWWLPDNEGGRRADLPFSCSVMARKPCADVTPEAKAHPPEVRAVPNAQVPRAVDAATGAAALPGAEAAPGTPRDEYLRANRIWWDGAVSVHQRTALYDVEGFVRGDDPLTPIERDELGPLVAEGTTLLHLQCHFGMDTLSWARRGATVTGVDFSGTAVDAARRLADRVGLSRRATFVRSDVFALPRVLDGTYDVVFSSWGVLVWLDDLERWADVVARYVRPGGTFYLAEFHPLVFLIDDGEHAAELRLTYPYFQGCEPSRWDEQGSYADPAAVMQATVTYEWQHTLSEVVTPLLRRGLRLDCLHEFPYTRGLELPCLERRDDGWQHLRDGRDDLPLSFSLRMTKQA